MIKFNNNTIIYDDYFNNNDKYKYIINTNNKK